MSSSGSGTVPDWVGAHWEHTYSTKRVLENGDKQPELVGGCTAVGMNDRVNQIQAVQCNNEVADVLCQSSAWSWLLLSSAQVLHLTFISLIMYSFVLFQMYAYK